MDELRHKPIVISTTEFAHGVLYGDYAGVIFSCEAYRGEPGRRLMVSDRFIEPLFQAILGRSSTLHSAIQVPRVIEEWNSCTGWSNAAAGVCKVDDQDSDSLLKALQAIEQADLVPLAFGASTEECQRRAAAIAELVSHARGRLLIEDD